MIWLVWQMDGHTYRKWLLNILSHMKRFFMHTLVFGFTFREFQEANLVSWVVIKQKQFLSKAWSNSNSAEGGCVTWDLIIFIYILYLYIYILYLKYYLGNKTHVVISCFDFDSFWCWWCFSSSSIDAANLSWMLLEDTVFLTSLTPKLLLSMLTR